MQKSVLKLFLNCFIVQGRAPRNRKTWQPFVHKYFSTTRGQWHRENKAGRD